MRPYALLYLYRRRLRVHAVQELLAGLGIAVAAGLLFATLVADGSVASSTDRVVRAVVGHADFQLRARSDSGFDQETVRTVKRLSGVRQAAPLLERTARIERSDGRSAIVDIAGTDPTLILLDGLARTIPFGAFSQNGIALSQTAATSLGIPHSWNTPGHVIYVSVRGSRVAMQLSGVLGQEAVGALASASVAVMPLKALQRIAGLPGRVSRILVEAEPKHKALVESELKRIAAGRLILAPATQDEQLLRKTLAPGNQASTLFAAIAVLLGFLFAFNAMLLTIPERRKTIAELRLDGTRRKAIGQMVLFQALCLGLVASLIGVLAGYGLSRGLFHQSPGYLSQAFTLGTGTIVSATPVLLALGGGLLAAVLASLPLMLDLRSTRAVDAIYSAEGEPGSLQGARAQRLLLALSLALLLAATSLFALAPNAALVACIVLALATVLSVPVTHAFVLRAAELCAQRWQRLTQLPVALNLLRATTLRSLALAATGALALFGSIALGGARSDLLHGIARYTSHYVAGANVWVINPHDNQSINDFDPDALATKIKRVPGVRAVEPWQGGFLDIGTRRVWTIAWPSGVPAGLLRDQLVEGNVSEAQQRLAQGGWITVSQQLADSAGAKVGGSMTIPTPSGPRSFRVAATTSNFGWSPGAIVLDRPDYIRAWSTTAPTALGVTLAPGASAHAASAAIASALGPRSGLEVLSASARAADINASASEGLAQLGDITTLLLLAAILAMGAAVASSIWQQRVVLAAWRIDGTKSDQLRRLLAIEVLLMVLPGCATGALAGLYGRVVIDGYLVHVTGFPVASSLLGRRPLEIFALLVLSVLAVASVPGWLASRVPPKLALAED